MRRVLAMLLLALLGLPFALPLLAAGQDAEAGLPACCRRNGKHHCMMRMDQAGDPAGHAAQLRNPAERCPHPPAMAATAHPDKLGAPVTAAAIVSGPVSHPTGVAQTESKRRIARDRSRQKRGPPAPTLL